ncbi:MAG TPA: tetratricopeptide repeat protein [Bryobacterales bacterium]|nr:tetratricopeptide repeat protein [Bryobacterales bacterium]
MRVLMAALLGAALFAAARPAADASLEKQADQSYRARDWAAAARLYQAFHDGGGGTASTYDNLGVALASLGRWSEAEAALRKAVEINPRHRWAYNHLGFVYREQGRYEEAIAMFRRQIEFAPRDPYAYRNLAGALVMTGRLDDAEKAAAENQKYTYERGAVYIDMACNLNSQSHPQQAKKYLDQAAAAGVERSLLAQESAHYFLTLRDYRSAEQQYLKLAEYQPYDPVVAMRLGALYWSTGNLDKAAAAFGRAIRVDERDQVRIQTSANTSKTVSLEELRRDPGAGAAVLGDVPADLGRAALLVRLAGARANPVGFERLCREFLTERNPAPAEAWLHDALGWMLAQNGQTPAAVEELDRAWALAPARMTAYHLGVALEKSGDLEKALPFYARSLAPLPETQIDCGCEQPDLAAREQAARAFYAKLRGDAAGFEAYRQSLVKSP